MRLLCAIQLFSTGGAVFFFKLSVANFFRCLIVDTKFYLFCQQSLMLFFENTEKKKIGQNDKSFCYEIFCMRPLIIIFMDPLLLFAVFTLGNRTCIIYAYISHSLNYRVVYKKNVTGLLWFSIGGATAEHFIKFLN